MEMFELVRDIENTPDSTAPARIARSRTRVVAGLDGRGRHRVHSRWGWSGVAGLGGLAVAAAAAAIVIVGTAAPIVVQPPSAAAEVLNAAADVVITGADPTIGPGQYLRIRETYERVSLWDADAATSDPVAGFTRSTLLDAAGAVRARGIRDLYVPANRAQDWILDDRAKNEVINVWGDPRSRDAYDQMATDAPGRDEDPDGITILPRGLYDSTPKVTPSPNESGDNTTLPTSMDDEFYDRFRLYYDDMPRDPAQLLAWYRDHLTTSSDDWYVFQAIGQGLGTNLMPSDLRAASLRALGLLSNVEVAATTGTIATLALPTPLDSGGEFGDLLVSELDIDTSSGQVVGIRETYPHRSTALLPSGVPWTSSQITITVVDGAPTP